MAEIAQCSSDTEKSNRNVSVYALRTKTRTILSSLLNPVKVLPSDAGLPRDWRGLAELVGIGGERIPQMHTESDPTVKVLNLWSDADRNNSTVAKLLEHLETLDRFDAIDDVKPLIDEDIQIYRDRLTKTAHQPFINNLTSTPEDTTILTVDDLPRIRSGLEPQHYDAFVLFADDDIDFATQLIDTLEKTYKLKLCVKDRDVVGGTIELDVIVRLIAERCNRLVVIISQSFFLSNANKYFVSFAQSIGIEQGKRKIIPCIYSSCKIPPELSCYFMLDYTKAGKLWNFWDKLYDSIQVSKAGSRCEVARSVSMQVRRCQVPTLQHSTSHTNGIRPKRNSNNTEGTTTHKRENSSTVKFNSALEIVEGVVNGTKSSNGSINGSESSGTGDIKKNKSRISWFKKIMPKSHQSSRKLTVMETVDNTMIAAPNVQNVANTPANVNVEKGKRNFWNRRVKRKVELVN